MYFTASHMGPGLSMPRGDPAPPLPFGAKFSSGPLANQKMSLAPSAHLVYTKIFFGASKNSAPPGEGGGGGATCEGTNG